MRDVWIDAGVAVMLAIVAAAWAPRVGGWVVLVSYAAGMASVLALTAYRDEMRRRAGLLRDTP